jgi:sec-independent protein translocase protein TatB
MFDLAWSHILLLGVVALLVIGPKDLPRVLRTLGVWVGRARAIARDFQGSLDQMIREAELEDVRKEVEEAATVDLDHSIEHPIDEGEFTKPVINEETAATLAGAPALESTTSPALPAATEPHPPEGEPAPPIDHAGEAPSAVPKSGTHD